MQEQTHEGGFVKKKMNKIKAKLWIEPLSEIRGNSNVIQDQRNKQGTWRTDAGFPIKPHKSANPCLALFEATHCGKIT